ncbi:G-protein coupled receptor family C group 5 member C-like [Genypterus blacodes]|uniref:G-protein coupled receptor family C group 5 member C-like n=1 Tax=Genypterus blacodes TaxID=154954 RepID=UPI003F76C947
MATTGAPRGCGADTDSLYYNLCDLTTLWGVVVEAIAIAGLVTSFIAFMSLIGSVPFVTHKKRKDMVVLQASFLLFTFGLFGLTFAFIIGQFHITCSARRFLFGVLFSGCFSCLVIHGLWIAPLDWKGVRLRSWMFWLGALALWLIEIIINAEWLIVSTVRNPLRGAVISDLSCSIANEDFVTALIYVMVLLVAAVLVALPSVMHKRTQWRKDGAFILVTGLSTLGIWLIWIVMYLYGNKMEGNPTWDDPTLAIAVVLNAWVFLVLYSVPELCLLTKEDPDPPESDDEDQPANVIPQYKTIKKPGVENEAFTEDEPAPTKPQLRSSVYKPTALTMMMQEMANKDQTPADVLAKAALDLRHRRTGVGNSPPPSAASPPTSEASEELAASGEGEEDDL